jgi:hypothetical protein
VAALTAAVFALTPAGELIGIDPLTAGALAVTLAVAAAGVALAAAGRRVLALPERL